MTTPAKPDDARNCWRCGKSLHGAQLCDCRLAVHDTQRLEAAEKLRRYRTSVLAPAAAKAEADRIADPERDAIQTEDGA